MNLTESAINNFIGEQPWTEINEARKLGNKLHFTESEGTSKK